MSNSNITIERLFDIERIKFLMVKDELYKGILNVKTLEDVLFDVLFNIWIVLYKDMQPIGVMCFAPLGKCLVFHGGIYKEYRGKDLNLIIKNVLNTVKIALPVPFLTTVPESNKTARRFVEKLGMKEQTTIKNGYENEDLVFYSEI